MMGDFSDRTIVGIIEEVTIVGSKGDSKTVLAKIDTGATKSSIDLGLASEIKIGPVKRTKLVKSAHGTKLRPIAEAEVKIQDRKITADFTLADRSHMKYPLLIGVNILKKGFLIDPLK